MAGNLNRPGIDVYFSRIAAEVSKRSTCDRAIVGAVLTLNNRILSTGYNGAPAGLEHCDHDNHLMVSGHCVRTVHAEANALVQAALHGTSTKGATCYTTHFPCFICTKLLINAGIVRIVYDVAYRPDEHAIEFLGLAGVEVDRVRMT